MGGWWKSADQSAGAVTAAGGPVGEAATGWQGDESQVDGGREGHSLPCKATDERAAERDIV